jgi:hypothetical protein
MYIPRDIQPETMNSRYSLASSAHLLALYQDKKLQLKEYMKTKVD